MPSDHQRLIPAEHPHRGQSGGPQPNALDAGNSAPTQSQQEPDPRSAGREGEVSVAVGLLEYALEYLLVDIEKRDHQTEEKPRTGIEMELCPLQKFEIGWRNIGRGPQVQCLILGQRRSDLPSGIDDPNAEAVFLLGHEERCQFGTAAHRSGSYRLRFTCHSLCMGPELRRGEPLIQAR